MDNHLRTCEKMWKEDESTTVKTLIALDKRNPHHIADPTYKGRDVPARPKLPTGQSVGRSVGRSIDQSINQSISHSSSGFE